MAYLILGAGMLLLSIVFRLAAIFRLTVPLVYALLVPTLFHSWYGAHPALVAGIFYFLLAAAVLSWAVSLARHIRHILAVRREARFSEAILRQRLRENRAHGLQAPGGGFALPVDDLWRDAD